MGQWSDRNIILAGVAFSLLNAVFIWSETYWGLLLPLGLALVAALVLALDKVLLFLVFSTPLSIFYFNEDLHIGFTLPTEPILFGVMLLFAFRLLHRGRFDEKVVRHPLSLVIFAMLLWMMVTSISSELPLVSIKYFLARLWFVTVFYLLMTQVLKVKRYVQPFFWLYMLPLVAVVLYTVYIHSQYGFTRQTSTWVMYPFFKEHTSYGAVLAMYIPVAFVMTFVLRQGLGLRILGFLVLGVLLVGVVLSFTRAAWVSLVVALLVMFLILFRVRKGVLLALAILFGGFLWYSWSDLMDRFQSNTQVSSDNLTEHVSSISNLSTDASNMERINRWKSAFRMFEERPWLGHGPGTYMFLYAPYQKPHEKTIISTNAGDLGNAHSEYIGPLAEQGWPGLLIVLLLVGFTVYYGVQVYYRVSDYNLRYLALAALLGLVTYWTHGFLNNFLEMDKASCPVWGFTAFLVVLDCYHTEEKRPATST